MGSVVQIIYAGNQYRIDNAKYNAANKIRSSSNIASGAEATLANFSRSLGNQVRQENAGKQYNAAVSQIADQLDTRGALNLNTSLAATQQLGAIQAGAAAAGVGGSSIQLLDQVTELHRNIQQDQQTTDTNKFSKSATMAATQSLVNGQGQLDFAQTSANVDTTQSVAPVAMKNRFGTLVAVAVATYFGGPQAGQAVADSAIASNKAANGDYDGSAKMADRAMSGYVGAASGYAKSGGQSWWSQVTGGSGSSGSQSSGGAGVDYGVLGSGNSTGNMWGQSSNSGFNFLGSGK